MKIFSHDKFGNILTLCQRGQVWFNGYDIAKGLQICQPNDAIIRFVEEKDRISSFRFLRRMDNSDLALRLRRLKGWMLTYEGVKSLLNHPLVGQQRAEEYIAWIGTAVLPNIDNKEVLSEVEKAKAIWKLSNVNKDLVYINTVKKLHTMQKLVSMSENLLSNYIEMKANCYEVIGNLIRQYSWDNKITLTKVWRAYIDLLDLKMDKNWYHGDSLKEETHISDIKIYRCIDIQGLPKAIALAAELTQTNMERKEKME